MTTATSDLHTVPTSRLHAAAIALARWDYDDEPEEKVLDEHWDGAKAVQDALTPKVSSADGLQRLPRGSVVYRADRDGVTAWRRHRFGWSLILRNSVAVSAVDDRALTSPEVAAHGSVRVLWAPQ